MCVALSIKISHFCVKKYKNRMKYPNPFLYTIPGLQCFESRIQAPDHVSGYTKLHLLSTLVRQLHELFATI